MKWWSIAIAAAAFAVSATTYLASRRRDRRDLFLRVHERLASVELQEGRRLMHELLRDQEVPVNELLQEQHALINHALSNLNVACFYYRRRYVSREDMLDLWGRPLERACDSAATFLAYRDTHNGGVPIWPDLRSFAADARRHRCTCDRWWRRWTRFLG